MSRKVRPGRTALVLGAALLMLVSPSRVLADSAEDINSRVAASLPMLYQNQPLAQTLAQSAKGILVFPNIVKAGFMFGAQYGEGALTRTAARSATTAPSPPRTDSRPVSRCSVTRCSS